MQAERETIEAKIAKITQVEDEEDLQDAITVP